MIKLCFDESVTSVDSHCLYRNILDLIPNLGANTTDSATPEAMEANVARAREMAREKINNLIKLATDKVDTLNQILNDWKEQKSSEVIVKGVEHLTKDLETSYQTELNQLSSDLHRGESIVDYIEKTHAEATNSFLGSLAFKGLRMFF